VCETFFDALASLSERISCRSSTAIHRLFITERAQREMQQFVEHLRAYGVDFAEEQLARLSFEVSTYVFSPTLCWTGLMVKRSA
jgi:hypothetical protein